MRYNINIDRKKQRVKEMRENFFRQLVSPVEIGGLRIPYAESVILTKENVEDAKLVCSTPLKTTHLKSGFTAASTFFVIDNFPIVEAEFLHHGSELLVKAQNQQGCLKMIFKYQSFVKIAYEISRESPATFKVKLIFTSKHSPQFFAKPEIDGDENYIRIPVQNSPADRFYSLCHSTAFQLCFCLDKPSLDALFFQLYSLLTCPIIFHQFTESQIEITNAIDDFIGDWPWECRYYVEVIKSCGFIGSFFLSCYLFNIFEFLYNADGTFNEAIAKMYLTNLNEFLKADLSWSAMDLPGHVFDLIPREDGSYELLKTTYITPTRTFYTFEETTLNSRGFRLLGIENLLLVKFRDDTLWNFPPDDVDQTILSTCKDGIRIAGKEFHEFGGSSSLFRDFGTYFYATSKRDVIPRIWNQWGIFKIEPAAKVAARIGQYFTSAKILGLKLPQSQVELIDDFYSRAVDADGKPYCFSDGVGLISQTYAEEISRKLQLPYTASAFQIRYAGYKGMLSVDPYYPFFEGEPFHGPYKICFRKSQKKFHVEDDRALDFEIVQASTANPANLHRIFIVMLDALAYQQGRQEIFHHRLEQLQNEAFVEIIKPLVEKDAFLKKFEKLPKYVPVTKLKSGNLINEPFLRSMVEADAVLGARLLSTKSKIPIPPTLGMPLEFDDLKIRASTRKTTIKRGPVGVTKSPIHHAGDIRFLNAVDIPELRHLIDVVVFPSDGIHRPVTDEIGGGDLDGDMYVVFWDPAWLLPQNVKAASYASPSMDKLKKVDLKSLQEEFPKFRAEYTKESNMNRLDSAHLAHLILHRPDHRECEKLGGKADIAVNYFKSGLKAKNLEEDEKPGIWPKFKGRHEPTFTASHILCQLHEKAENFYQLIQIAQKEAMKQREKSRVVRNRIEITAEDKFEFEEYKSKLEILMQKYQLKSEGELFANAFLEISGDFKSSDKKFGETSAPAMVQQKVFAIFEEYRSRVLDRFQPNWRFIKDQNQIAFFDFKIMNVQPELISLAMKYYALSEENGKFFSFPWIAWEGLDAWWQLELNQRPIVIPPMNKNFTSSANAQATAIKQAFLSSDQTNISLYHQIINYEPFVVLIPNAWAEAFQKGSKILAQKSGCQEAVVGVKKTFQNRHHFTVMCRGSLESCQKLENMLTPFIDRDDDNSMKFGDMKKRKNQEMINVLKKLFDNSP